MKIDEALKLRKTVKADAPDTIIHLRGLGDGPERWCLWIKPVNRATLQMGRPLIVCTPDEWPERQKELRWP